MNKTITMKMTIDEKLLERQAKLIGKIRDDYTLYPLVASNKISEKKRIVKEQELLEGVWEMCHCILDQCDRNKNKEKECL